MTEYAPGAPGWLKRYPAKLIGAAKITAWDLWARADHDDQRGCEMTIVFVKPDPGEQGSPSEIFRRHVARDTGQTIGQVVAHLTKLRALGLVDTHGLAATLYWKTAEPDSEKPGVRSGNPDKRSGKSGDRSGNPDPEDRENRVKRSGKPDPGSGNPDGLSGKPVAPIKPPSPPQDPPTHLAREPDVEVDLFGNPVNGCAKPVTFGDLLTTWWRDRYSTIRGEIYARWRPDAKIRVGEISKSKRKAIGKLLDEHTDATTPAARIEILDHVLDVIAGEIAGDKGEIREWTDSHGKRQQWDTVRRIDDYWLRDKHFARLVSASVPPVSRRPDRGYEPPPPGMQAHELEREMM